MEGGEDEERSVDVNLTEEFQTRSLYRSIEMLLHIVTKMRIYRFVQRPWGVQSNIFSLTVAQQFIKQFRILV